MYWWRTSRSATSLASGSTGRACARSCPSSSLLDLRVRADGAAAQPQPGYDFAVQAMSGLMSITGPRSRGRRCKAGVAVTDVLTGLYAAVAVLACLQARERSGHGYAIWT